MAAKSDKKEKKVTAERSTTDSGKSQALQLAVDSIEKQKEKLYRT